MYRSLKYVAAALLAAGLFATVPSHAAHAATTLKKIGAAIQYPVRKAGQNISITTHRIVGNKSVEHTNHGHNVVITPGGHKYLIHHRYAHHMYSQRSYTRGNRRYYYYNGHQYYENLKTGNRHMVH